MKTLALLLILAACLCCCKRDQTPVSNQLTCYPNGNYAKTATDAQQKLTGVWRLTRIVGGFVVNPTSPFPVANVTVNFRADNQLVVMVDGQEKDPVSYSIIAGPMSSSPQLEVSKRLEYSGSPGFSLGTSAIYVCDNELVLDYGLAVDATAQVYSRVK